MPPADNRAALAAATQHRAETTRERARAALRRLDTDGSRITVVAVATAAGVSRSLLYRDPDLRAEIDRIRARDPLGTTRHSAADRASDASLQQRLAAALEDNHHLRDQNRQLAQQVAALLGEQRVTTTHRPSARTIGPCS